MAARERERERVWVDMKHSFWSGCGFCIEFAAGRTLGPKITERKLSQQPKSKCRECEMHGDGTIFPKLSWRSQVQRSDGGRRWQRAAKPVEWSAKMPPQRIRSEFYFHLRIIIQINKIRWFYELVTFHGCIFSLHLFTLIVIRFSFIAFHEELTSAMSTQLIFYSYMYWRKRWQSSENDMFYVIRIVCNWKIGSVTLTMKISISTFGRWNGKGKWE